MFADASVAARGKSMGIRGGLTCRPLSEVSQKELRIVGGKHSGARGICILRRLDIVYLLFIRCLVPTAF